MTPVFLIIVFGAITVGLFIYGMSVAFGRRKAVIAERLETYASIEEEAALSADAEIRGMSPVPKLFHVLLGRSYMQRLEDDLAQADIPMKPSEYILVRLVLAAIGYLFGLYGMGFIHSAIFLAVLGFFIPSIAIKFYQRRRRTKFVSQLADALMLLTNSLRSGYGFLKGLELIAKEMGDPIGKELNRMLREVSLGATVEQALLNLGRRVNSQDLDIVISAFLIQKDVGGNLTEIMEKVAETIRERIRIQGDIRVLTAQGRLSGLIVGLLPVGLFLFFVLRAPDYFQPLLSSPKISFFAGLAVPVGVLMLVGAFLWQVVGGYFIYRIINIRV
jgi:tight adherence protein B